MRRIAIQLAASIAVVAVLGGCVSDVESEGGSGYLKPIGSYAGDERSLEQLYLRHRAPLVIINDLIYLPAEACLCADAVRGELESRHLAGETEGRSLGGETEQPALGGETEDRALGGEIEDRALGGETEGRDLSGESEDRRLAGESEARDLGGETEDRVLGGETEQPALGGETEDRALGGEIEDRALAGESEGRLLGGESESRDVAGETGRITCLRLSDRSGFLLGNVDPTAEIWAYYAGVRMSVVGLRVRYLDN